MSCFFGSPLNVITVDLAFTRCRAAVARIGSQSTHCNHSGPRIHSRSTVSSCPACLLFGNSIRYTQNLTFDSGSRGPVPRDTRPPLEATNCKPDNNLRGAPVRDADHQARVIATSRKRPPNHPPTHDLGCGLSSTPLKRGPIEATDASEQHAVRLRSSTPLKRGPIEAAFYHRIVSAESNVFHAIKAWPH